MQYLLTQRRGPEKGAVWPITEHPLVIGRERGCDIRIPDPVVSRRHCEIVLDGAVVRLRDFGSMNTPMVNGLPASACVLNPGDEVRVGRALFSIIQKDAFTDSSARKMELLSTLTLMEGESALLAASPTTRDTTAPENTYTELAELFHLSRRLGRAKSTADLHQLIGNAVRARFQPDAAWLMLLEHGRERYIVLRGGAGKTAADAAVPSDLIARALEERRSSLVARRAGGDGGVESVLTAPIYMGEHSLGGLSLARSAPKRPYEDFDLDYLVTLAHIVSPHLKAIERIEELERENLRLRAAEEHAAEIVGTSPAIRRIRETIKMVAPATHPVLILGETGTGKELVATLVHRLSNRAHGLLVTVNCAAIPRELFESEFFGHEKGAFTGAVQRKVGLLEQSNGGTLFLDEIGDLAPEHQSRILRAIETQEFRRVGGTESIRVDFRLLAATNKDVAQELKLGRFRDDLYHRIKGVEVHIPPLRERPMDIPALAEHFLHGLAGERRRLSPLAAAYLARQPWPGNARELRTCIETALTFCQTETLDVDDLRAVYAPSAVDTPLLPLAELERQHIVKALEHFEWRVTEAAECLGISKSKLYNKIAEYGLKR